MQYLQIIAALLPIIEQLITAIEAASHPGSTIAVPPQASRLRAMVGDVRALIGATGGEDRLSAVEKGLADLHAALATGGPASVQKAVADVEVPATSG